MAPADWQVIDMNKEGSAFTVSSPDRRTRASWGIVPVNRGAVAGYYGAQFKTPASFAQYLTGIAVAAQVSARQGPRMPYGFQSLVWNSMNGLSGYVVFRAFPLPSDPRGYILSYRIGGGQSSQPALAPLALSVAASIRCVTQLRPPPPNDFHPAKGAKCVGSECSESDAASGSVNAILGTAWVHDSSGGNFYVGSESWLDNGKDGPGYYRRTSNGLTKLELGIQ